jgi:pimeloyl-ACP methyl ester carboxylesterase
LFGWLIADARPNLVKGIVAVEPSGPPYKNVGARPSATRPWGLTYTPLTYDPPVTTEAPLEFEQRDSAERENLVACWLQKGTPRKLSNLADVPTLIVTAEASHHAPFDHCTSRYLEQAGVANDFMRPYLKCRSISVLVPDRHTVGSGHASKPNHALSR